MNSLSTNYAKPSTKSRIAENGCYTCHFQVLTFAANDNYHKVLANNFYVS